MPQLIIVNRLALRGRNTQSAEQSIELGTICAETNQYISLGASLCA